MPLNDSPETQIRLTEAKYADGQGEAVVTTDPVLISSQLFDQDGDMANSAGLSNMFVAWGQFLDHDLTLTPEGEDETLGADGLMAPLHRSSFEIDEDGARVPFNAISWQIDGSQIYGTTTERMMDLRSFDSGHLRMGEDPNSDMGLMPNADPDSFMAGDITSDDPVFLSGDIRANENPALASVHTLMAREHNYWADRLAEEHPEWDDEQLFQGARSIVEYELQKITYDEWLPHLIGDAAGPDTGYDPDVNGQVSVEFSTAAFRFGHTMVSSTIKQLNADGTDADEGDIAIMDAFFNDDIIKTNGIDGLLRGQAATTAQEYDTKVVDDLNFFLASPAGLQGFSLVALNVLRGADHGLQSYVDTRAALLGDVDPATLDPTDFSVITSDPDGQAALAAVYDSVHDVELWVGGLAEDSIGDTQLGPLFTHIVADQFSRTRAADESFGALDPALGAEIIADLQASTFADIILRNTEIDAMQDDPFVASSLGLAEGMDFSSTAGTDEHDLVSLIIREHLATGAGEDILSIRGGTQLLSGVNMGTEDDHVTMSSGLVEGLLRLGEGDDSATLSGDATVDYLLAGAGNDTVAITEGATVEKLLNAGDGDDTIDVGSRATVGRLVAGDGDDQINIAVGANIGTIDGNDGIDTLDVTGGPFRVDWTNDDPSTGSGTVVYLNRDGTETGETVPFINIENVTCFTPGTNIITARGARAIETLEVGDLIYTLDDGLQPLRWIGRTTVLADGDNAPIRIAAGALGNSRTMEVSPQHRMLLSDWRAELICGEEEVLAAAKHLTNDTSITRRTGGPVAYIHLLFDSHQIVFADGIPSESFHPGAVGLEAMDAGTRDEILRLFPELEADLNTFGPAARLSAKEHQIRVIRSL